MNHNKLGFFLVDKLENLRDIFKCPTSQFFIWEGDELE